MNYQTRQKIRKMYQEILPQIKRHYPKFDVYAGDWTSWLRMTPIEENVWSDIRVVGLPMVPQFPVGRYFVDFADPIKKIAIEVDGKRWHTDKEKDIQRQKEIEKMGWEVYRIEGRKTFTERDDYFTEDIYYTDLEELEEKLEEAQQEFYEECSEGILQKIKEVNYKQVLNH